MESKIEVLSTVQIKHSEDLYKIVDLLNRTLKREDLMFGLALDQEDQKSSGIYDISHIGEA
ncbi:hypothetical protein BsIDN1_38890 [Bacillus safensis]|uniref:DUF4264 domain-containing protein n=1 Tax=Bacillus safensis TaxID=561879 RepID=A0A5S9MBJ6_BACIA|nr:hypothetical protein BsIDN1_38890 [Bacillus safensis]